MAKRRKRIDAPMMPTPEQQRKWAAESAARTMMDTSPRMGKMRDEIRDAVLQAGEKILRKHGGKKAT